MRLFKPVFLLLTNCFLYAVLPAQVTIPAFTGYAIPMENGSGEEESTLFSEKEGLHGWTNPRQQLRYFFNAGATGSLKIYLLLKNARPGNKLQLNVAGSKFTVQVPVSKKFTRVFAGAATISTTGFYTISISAAKAAPGRRIADIQSIELGGSAAGAITFNAKPRRNAASVHLKYPVPDTAKVVNFYSELTVPDSADKLYSYYMADGFARGYFGMQVISPTERRIIFSVWDAGSEPDDRNKVSEDNKVQLLAKGDGVVAGDFGNEGTGGHSHWVYNWKAGTKYKFLVTALPDSASHTSIYTAYFFIPDLQQWKLIAAFKAPKDGEYLHGLYSFVENFVGENGQQQRKAFFGNQWIRTESGQWNEITQATFSYDATGKAGDRTDYGAGAENAQFYLWNGGFQPATASYGQVFTRTAVAQAPVIDLYKNADSAVQAAKDKIAILDAIAAGSLDTSGSKDGVYYQMIKEGNGTNVLVSDTVVAFYKGALLNGQVFDETKYKPATFPLNRLIKGWQLGLPLCKTGGKIRLIIPSALAYSIRTRSPKIPPNSVLVFDIEVVETRRGG